MDNTALALKRYKSVYFFLLYSGQLGIKTIYLMEDFPILKHLIEKYILLHESMGLKDILWNIVTDYDDWFHSEMNLNAPYPYILYSRLNELLT